MRVPFSRVYRAYPELDRFTDSECERFIELSRRLEPWHGAAMGLAQVAAMVGVFLLMVTVWRAAPALLPGRWLGIVRTSPGLLLAMGVVSFASAPMAGLLVRDAMLRRAIGRHLDLSKCIGCGYSLLGLPAHGGGVRCPECGRFSTLAELRLTAAQLLSREASGEPATPAPGCSSAAPASGGPSAGRP